MDYTKDQNMDVNVEVFNGVSQEYWKAHQNRKYWQEQEKELQEELREMTEDRSFSTQMFQLLCTERKGSIQYNKIPELQEVDLEAYRGSPVRCWKVKKRVQLQD